MEPFSKSDEKATSEAEDPGSPGRLSDKTSFSTQPKPYARTHGGQTASTSFLQFLGGLFRGGGTPVGQPETALGATHEMSAMQENPAFQEALENLLREHAGREEGPIVPEEERRLVGNILRFVGLSVSDIMIPRTDITAIADTASLDEIKATYIEHQHSRLPVYEESLDNIKGFLHIKDLAIHMFAEQKFHMPGLMRQILFVPPSMKLMDLLLKMRLSSVHIAIVVDEYGGTDGLVTMEDIVEEIVGEIQDEHDEVEDRAENMVWINERTLETDARMEIETLDKCFGKPVTIREDEDDFDTVGGLIFDHLGRVPEQGESFDYPTGLKITILEADPRSVKRVRIEQFQPEEAAEHSSAKAAYR